MALGLVDLAMGMVRVSALAQAAGMALEGWETRDSQRRGRQPGQPPAPPAATADALRGCVDEGRSQATLSLHRFLPAISSLTPPSLIDRYLWGPACVLVWYSRRCCVWDSLLS
ncbi:hypothetical protein E2C01_061231 [Portunus trituberculatus]|uniref:Uncharacterized protein n=1 Tax=Portunus trituberculatus TaxID=210409 RepID=A0A5B7HCL3_PORTR|nr:hypothetical protein [Portunus trituberculatus]